MTFALVLRVRFVTGALTMTAAAGTDTETITDGACAGQYRSFDLALVGQ